jgi:uncharacterized membrane protein
LPPIPTDWSALHPLVVHFPIALLIVAPLLVVIAMLARSNRRPYLVSALVLMVMGTIGTWVAVSTGKAAGELAESAPALAAAVERHEELAEATRTAFTAITLVFAAILVVPMLLKRKPEGALFVGSLAVFLVVYLVGAGLLANAAHEGGMLVHGDASATAATSRESTAPSHIDDD